MLPGPVRAQGRRGAAVDQPASREGGLRRQHGYYTTSQSALISALSTTPVDKRACVGGAPLSCNPGSLEARCLTAGRPCTTAAENARDPWLELRWHPRVDRYLWGVRIVLPSTAQLAQLFVGPKTLRLYGDRGQTIPCAEGDDEIYELRDRYVVTIVCPASDFSESNLHALGGAQRLLLTLVGEHRQIWFQSIEIVERTYTSAGIGRRPPPPPPPPKRPPVR